MQNVIQMALKCLFLFYEKLQNLPSPETPQPPAAEGYAPRSQFVKYSNCMLICNSLLSTSFIMKHYSNKNILTFGSSPPLSKILVRTWMLKSV